VVGQDFSQGNTMVGGLLARKRGGSPKKDGDHPGGANEFYFQTTLTIRKGFLRGGNGGSTGQDHHSPSFRRDKRKRMKGKARRKRGD